MAKAEGRPLTALEKAEASYGTVTESGDERPPVTTDIRTRLRRAAALATGEDQQWALEKYRETFGEDPFADFLREVS